MSRKSDFAQWARHAGFNGKQVSAAGAAIGMKETSSRQSNVGGREFT